MTSPTWTRGSIDPAPRRTMLTRRRTLAVAFAAAATMTAAACVPPDSGGTTTTSTVSSADKSVTNATFEWTVSREVDNGAMNGQPNYWSAGQSDSTQGTYVATNANATVLKKNAAGTYVAIGSESAVSWANRNKDGAGNNVTATNANYLGQKVRYTGGTGTVNTTTGAATIQWSGTFTVNFYGPLVPFWITDPKLTVTPNGSATLTARMGGFASSMDNPDVRVSLPTRDDVTIATFSDVYNGASIATGWTKAPNYLGTAVTTSSQASPQVASTPANAAYWVAWPQSFVDFQNDTGLGSYWYTSGTSSIDAKKVQEPVSVAYVLAP